MFPVFTAANLVKRVLFGNLIHSPTNCFCFRVLAHYSEVSLLLEGRSDFPEELKGTKKGMLYLTQYKVRGLEE